MTPLKTNPDYSYLTVEEGNHPFTECAIFADFIKSKPGFNFQNDWHYTNDPLLDDGQTIEQYPLFQLPEVGIVDALYVLTKFLKGDPSATYTTYVQEIKSIFSSVQD